MKKRFSNIHPAVIAVWAAIVAAGHALPTIPIWGTGSPFSLNSVLSPLSGIFFGPIAGAFCSAAGGFIGSLFAPHTAWLGPWTFIVGTVTAYTSGCIAWGKWPPVTISGNGSFIINGGVIVYITGTILWFTQEIGRSVVIFPIVFYGLGFIAFIAGNIFSSMMFASSKKYMRFPAIWLCAFGGLIGGASVANFFFLILYKLPKENWYALAFAAPVERAVFAAGAMLVGVPLLTGLEKIGIFAGPGQDAVDLPEA
ncbi:MAG: ECF transporter S component [Treponema sp.]|jgi:hypothetical protein|nr:ECF transporter S component [Treponema sp.]